MNKPKETNPPDLWCDHCECSPCCCFERQIWDDEGGQLTRSYEPSMEKELNKILDALEEEMSTEVFEKWVDKETEAM